MERREELYWCGTFPECGAQNLSLKGVSFSRKTVTMVQRGDTLVAGGEYPGEIHSITPEKAQEVRKAIAIRVSRWFGKAHDGDNLPGARGRVYNTEHPGYRPEPQDEPLFRGVFFEKITAEQAQEIRGTTIKPKRLEPGFLDTSTPKGKAQEKKAGAPAL